MTIHDAAEKGPNEALADLVLSKLKDNGFIAEGRAQTIAAKLAAGTATRDDWKLWIELAKAKSPEDNANGTD